MNKPNVNLISVVKKQNPAVLKTEEQTPPRLRDVMEAARSIAKYSAQATWDQMANYILDTLSGQTTGDELLAITTTLLAYFSAYFIENINVIAKKDVDAGRTKQDIFDTYVSGLKKLLELN